MKKLTVIFALTWGIVSGAQEECMEGESCTATPASGRSVLQKQQHRSSFLLTEDATGKKKANATGNCDYQQCNKDTSLGWDRKCTRMGLCEDCSKCDEEKEAFDALWPPPAGGADWLSKCEAAKGTDYTPAGKKNILILMVDDMNADGGGPGAKHPHMDYLASKGVRFPKAYAASPICAPSRASIMSGIIASVSHYNFGRKGIDSSSMDEKVEWYNNECLAASKTFMEFFRSKCYLVIGTGKLNHDEIYHPAECPWPCEGQWDYYYAKADYGPGAYNGEGMVGHPHMPQAMTDEFGDSYIDFNWARMSEVPFTEIEGGWVDSKWRGGGWKYSSQYYPRPTGMFKFNSNTDRDPMPDEYNAAWAIETLKKLAVENTGQPFLLMVGFVRPHTPMYCPDEYWDMFPLDQISMPPTVGVNFKDVYYDDVSMVDSLLGYRLYRHLATDFDSAEDGFRRWYQAYYSCVAFVDAQVGKVVDYLEGSQWWDNTIVAFFADNGWNNGPKQYVFKNGPWEDGTKVPLIIRAPGAQEEGHVSDELANLVDVYPTLLTLTGFDPAVDTIKDPSKGAPLSGKSLTSALAGETSSDFDYAISQIYPTSNKVILEWPHCNTDPTCNHFAVRSRTHRYILYNSGEEELYSYGDAGDDTEELVNLASDDAYASVKAGLKAQLETMESIAPFKDNLGTWNKGQRRPYDKCCENFCFTNPKDWSKKCGWGSCTMCNECPNPALTCTPASNPTKYEAYVVTEAMVTTVTPAPTPPPAPAWLCCEAWCATNSRKWSKKCTFNSCIMCGECESPPAECPLKPPPPPEPTAENIAAHEAAKEKDLAEENEWTMTAETIDAVAENDAYLVNGTIGR